MGIIKIRRPKANRLVGLEHVPVYDVFTISGEGSTVKELRFLYSMVGGKRIVATPRNVTEKSE